MPEPRKKCFVVMGFGTKTDFQQQKSYDLDKTYRIIIRPAVEQAGLECIRADDVMHSGVIDKPMYELLLEADVVVADLSTSNANALYELGVRHALRPYRTIVIAESNFTFPFDIKSLLIRPYKHLGEGIDAEDADAARAALRKAIEELACRDEPDSPVYTFLPGLRQPAMERATQAAAVSAAAQSTATAQGGGDGTVSMLLEMFQQARAESNWSGAKLALERALGKLPGDPYVVQQLALSTYKADPDSRSALEEARGVLSALAPRTSNDPETLGIWGAIHKRLYELDGDRADLDEAIRSYGKGFHLKDDPYNGINYSYALNLRAKGGEGPEAVADFYWAQRVRHHVIAICEAELAAGPRDDAGNVDRERDFWLRATLSQALVGTGQAQRAEEVESKAAGWAPEPWMVESMRTPNAALAELVASPPSLGSAG